MPPSWSVRTSTARVSHLKPGDILDNQLKDGLGSLDVSLVSREPDSSTHSLIEQLAFSVIFKTIVPPVMCRHALHRRFMSTTCAQFDEEADKPNLQARGGHAAADRPQRRGLQRRSSLRTRCSSSSSS